LSCSCPSPYRLEDFHSSYDCLGSDERQEKIVLLKQLVDPYLNEKDVFCI